MNIKFIGILFFIIFLIAEKQKPYFKNAKDWKSHDINNIIIGGINALLSYLISIFLSIKILNYIRENGIGLFNIYEFKFFRGILIFLILDLWLYFWHRFNHRIEFLRRFHIAHHTDNMMGVSTALRFHPIEILLSFIVKIPLYFLIGVRVEELLFYELLLNVLVYFHHSNIKIDDRLDYLIRYFIVSPNMHKNHHSIKLKETDSNFSSILSIWDRIFKTYTDYKRRDNFKYGIPKYKESRWQKYYGILWVSFIKED